MSDLLVEGHTILRLPKSHWHCQLANVVWDAIKPRALYAQVEQFVERTLAGEAPHLLLTGTPGICKTHVGVGIYRTLAARLGTELVTWISVPAFCEDVKRGYDDGSTASLWDDYERARRLVVLDDLFGRELTPHEKDQIFTRLLDTAYRNGAAVLATMNPPHTELASRLPPHEISRLLADCAVVPMTSTKDWRRA